MKRTQWICICAVMFGVALIASSVWAQAPQPGTGKTPGKRPGGAWDDIGPLNVSYESPYPTGGPPLLETYVLSKDRIYVPVIVRKPEGEGPFPALLCIHGIPGGRGMTWLKNWASVRNREPLERFVKEGYVIAYTDYRQLEFDARDASVGDPNQASDSGDCLAVLRYLKTLPYVDKNRVGIFGVSLGGAITLRVANAEPVSAIILGAPAAMGVLGYKRESSEGGTQPEQPDVEIPDSKINREMAEANLKNISCPVMIALGTQDQLLSIGKKVLSLLQGMGKDATIKFYEGQPHGFYWGGPARSDEPGGDTKAKLFAQFMDDCVAFFGKHVKGASR